MPVEAGSRLARVEVRQNTASVEDSKAITLTVVPPPDVLETEADFDGELRVDLNLVVSVERNRLVGDIRQRR